MVAGTSTFGTKDKIIVSVKTDASTAAIDAKLTYQDGQVAGQQTATVMAEDGGNTNVTLSNANPWTTGSYTVDVAVNGQAAGIARISKSSNSLAASRASWYAERSAPIF